MRDSFLLSLESMSCQSSENIVLADVISKDLREVLGHLSVDYKGHDPSADNYSERYKVPLIENCHSKAKQSFPKVRARPNPTHVPNRSKITKVGTAIPMNSTNNVVSVQTDIGGRDGGGRRGEGGGRDGGGRRGEGGGRDGGGRKSEGGGRCGGGFASRPGGLRVLSSAMIGS